MSTRTFRNFMGSPELAKLQKLASSQRQLDRLWQAALPPEMTGRTRVVGVDRDCFVVSTRSPAILAKLRQMESRLVERLNEGGLKVISIRCRIQVETLPHERKIPKRNPELSAAALDTLAEAAETLPDSPLREALANMVAKRRGNPHR
ncbi:MAG: DUF721 domain-containing protein [Burkholderiales bacterium]|nr:DUF721 domain-containing protein [Burkholderiales bacterium]